MAEKHTWRHIYGNSDDGRVHAWIRRRSGSVTYCGLPRIMGRTTGGPSQRCRNCEAKAKSIDRTTAEKAREFANRRRSMAERQKKRDAIAATLEAIRPESADPKAWREQAAKLVAMV